MAVQAVVVVVEIAPQAVQVILLQLRHHKEIMAEQQVHPQLVELVLAVEVVVQALLVQQVLILLVVLAVLVVMEQHHQLLVLL